MPTDPDCSPATSALDEHIKGLVAAFHTEVDRGDRYAARRLLGHIGDVDPALAVRLQAFYGPLTEEVGAAPAGALFTAGEEYLVLPRVLVRSMPHTWQQQFVVLCAQLRAAYAYLGSAPAYRVTAGARRLACELSAEELAAVGVRVDVHDAGAYPVYVTGDGRRLDPVDEVFVPAETNPHGGPSYLPPDPTALPRPGLRLVADPAGNESVQVNAHPAASTGRVGGRRR
jgi:hypothetical protein